MTVRELKNIQLKIVFQIRVLLKVTVVLVLSPNMNHQLPNGSGNKAVVVCMAATA